MKKPDIAMVIKNPISLRNISKPSLDVCIAAVMLNGIALKHVPDMLFTREEYSRICKAAVISKPKAISLIQKERLTWYSWKFVLLSAAKENGLALRWIKDQNPEICLAAIKQNPEAFMYVDKIMCDTVSPDCYRLLQKVAEEQHSKEKNTLRKKKYTKVVKNKIDLCKAEHQTETLCLKAVQSDGMQIKYVWKQTRKLCLAAMKQNPAASVFIRDQDLICVSDYFDVIVDGFKGISAEFSDCIFEILNSEVKEIPEILITKGKHLNHVNYYKLCKKALKINCCNLKFINSKMLLPEQYQELCIKAISEDMELLQLVNLKKIDSDCYFTICQNAIKNNSLIGFSFKHIISSFLSCEQYYNLIKTWFDTNPEDAIIHISDTIEEKKLGNKLYYVICKKMITQDVFKMENIKPKFLTKTQYYEFCLAAIKKDFLNIGGINKKRLEEKDWLKICKIAIIKWRDLLYNLDFPSKELLNYALKIGIGLKYISKQNMKQCLAVLKKNGNELRFIRPEQFSKEQYLELCKTSIKKNSDSLSYVDDNEIDGEEYQELCKIAIDSFSGVINYIDHKRIEKKIYYNWCKKIINNNSFWFKDIPFIDGYYNLCIKAVKKDKKNLENVKYLYFSKKQYTEICKAAGAKPEE